MIPLLFVGMYQSGVSSSCKNESSINITNSGLNCSQVIGDEDEGDVWSHIGAPIAVVIVLGVVGAFVFALVYQKKRNSWPDNDNSGIRHRTTPPVLIPAIDSSVYMPRSQPQLNVYVVNHHYPDYGYRSRHRNVASSQIIDQASIEDSATNSEDRNVASSQVINQANIEDSTSNLEDTYQSIYGSINPETLESTNDVNEHSSAILNEILDQIDDTKANEHNAIAILNEMLDRQYAEQLQEEINARDTDTDSRNLSMVDNNVNVDINRDNQGAQCCICMDEEARIVCVPCNHLCMCRNCCQTYITEGNRTCPQCRTEMERIMEVFY